MEQYSEYQRAGAGQIKKTHRKRALKLKKIADNPKIMRAKKMPGAKLHKECETINTCWVVKL